jgi:hypothetical protein
MDRINSNEPGLDTSDGQEELSAAWMLLSSLEAELESVSRVLLFLVSLQCADMHLVEPCRS